MKVDQIIDTALGLQTMLFTEPYLTEEMIVRKMKKINKQSEFKEPPNPYKMEQMPQISQQDQQCQQCQCSISKKEQITEKHTEQQIEQQQVKPPILETILQPDRSLEQSYLQNSNLEQSHIELLTMKDQELEVAKQEQTQNLFVITKQEKQIESLIKKGEQNEQYLVNCKPMIEASKAQIAGIDASQTILYLLNKTAQFKYKNMSERFRKMVPETSKFLSLFMCFNDPVMNEMKIFQDNPKTLNLSKGDVQIRKLRAALQGRKESICEACFTQTYKGGESKHRKRCAAQNKKKTDGKVMGNSHRYLGFTMDNEIFYCHLGCEDFETDSKRKMANHLLNDHSDEELKLWHIPTLFLTYF